MQIPDSAADQPIEGATPDQGEIARAQAQQALAAQMRSGASWFYWIAGGSIVNALLLFAGSQWSLAVGLGATEFINALALLLAEDAGESAGLLIRIVALCLDGGFAALFWLFGWFAHRRRLWAFIVGMALYALDALLMILFESWVGLAIHGLALYFLFRGLQAARSLRALR